MDATSIATIIAAALSLIGVIALGLWQNKIWKSQAKKADIEGYATLIDSLTKRTDAEFTIMKTLNSQQLLYITDLRQQILVLTDEKANLVKELVSVNNQLTNVTKELNEVKERLALCEIKLKDKEA